MTTIISVVGTSRSGKTTFLKQIIPLLKERGYTVCVVKHSHKSLSSSDVDKKGKDTYSFSEAGADEVWLTSPQFTFRLTNTETPLREIAERTHTDFVFTEGFKDALTPKVVIKKKGEDIHVNGEVLLTIEGEYNPEEILELLLHSFQQMGSHAE